MNHPHIKGAGTLFMQAHIHKDLILQPGSKFIDKKEGDTREKPRIFNERKLSVPDYLSLKERQSENGLGGLAAAASQ
jgi:hypothetical protein